MKNSTHEHTQNRIKQAKRNQLHNKSDKIHPPEAGLFCFYSTFK